MLLDEENRSRTSSQSAVRHVLKRGQPLKNKAVRKKVRWVFGAVPDFRTRFRQGSTSQRGFSATE